MSPRVRNFCRFSFSLCGALAVIGSLSSAVDVAAEDSHSQRTIEEQLIDRVRKSPDDASAWRMLGHLALECDRFDDAAAFLEHSLALNDLSAAAWFDLGRAQQELGLISEATRAYSNARNLAPESEYGLQAEQALSELAERQLIELADYQVREFNGLEHTDETPELETLSEPVTPTPLRLRLDTGVLYDSNVALSPLSRSLVPGNRSSAQFFIAPDLEYRLVERGGWRSGPRAAGNFTWNEPDFKSFNLQSYRPGWFWERDFFGETLVSSLRIDYQFAHDEFQTQTFGNRHAVVTVGTLFWDEVRATTLYWSSDYTNFANDGAVPSITSQDGWTNALGLTQEWGFNSPYLSVLRLGGQVERADTTGTDTLYNGFGLNAEVWVPIAQQTDGTLRGSWGIRDYPDFQSGPARDETIWSAAAEIRHRLTDALTLRGVVTMDRFVSDNPLFDAERFTTGVLVVYQR